MTNFVHVPAKHGAAYWTVGCMFRFLVSSDEANGSYTTMGIIVPPGEGANLHSHLHEEEQFSVLVSTHWSLDDAPQFLYTLISQMGFIKGPEEVFGMWKGDLGAYYHYGCCMVFQVHPQWIGRPGRLRMLERLLQCIRSFPDAWFATGREIDEYWRRRYPPEEFESAAAAQALIGTVA